MDRGERKGGDVGGGKRVRKREEGLVDIGRGEERGRGGRGRRRANKVDSEVVDYVVVVVLVCNFHTNGNFG